MADYILKVIAIHDPSDDQDCDEDFPESKLIIFDSLGNIVFSENVSYNVLEVHKHEYIFVLKIDENHKFSQTWMFLNARTRKIHPQFFEESGDIHSILYVTEERGTYTDGKILYKDKTYPIIYFFDNEKEIIQSQDEEDHRYIRGNTLLTAILDSFDVYPDEGCYMTISGFTFGMDCQHVKHFKQVPRDHTISIEEQLIRTLFSGYPNMVAYTVTLKMKFTAKGGACALTVTLPCTPDPEVNKNLPKGYKSYGYFDKDAKLSLLFWKAVL